MDDERIRVRLRRGVGELEIEGPIKAVTEWWEKLRPEFDQALEAPVPPESSGPRQSAEPSGGGGKLPELFGEFYQEFRADITDVDKVLIAAVFAQSKEPERTFTTKAANELLLAQGIKVANASVNVKRLIQSKRVFGVGEGRFRVSAPGLEHLTTLKVS